MTRRAPRRLTAEQLEARDVPATAFGLGTGANAGNLFRFDTATPATVTNIPISGTTAGDVIVGIDFRPATGQLYGVGANIGANSVQVYTIDFTGAATPVGTPQVFAGTNTILGAVSWGVDFNPEADRIRVVTDLASDADNAQNVNNFRLNPITGALVAVDPDLIFTGLPAGSAPETAVAYTNSNIGPAPATTTLLGIVSGTDQLVTASGTGFATLGTPLPLGVVTDTNNAGLDIFGPNNTTVAVLSVAGVTGLYSINTGNGAATLVGPVGNGGLLLADVAVAPPTQSVVASGTLDGKVQLLTPVGGALTAGTSVTAFTPSTANVRSASADVNGDGTPDLVLVTGPGTPIRVTVLSGIDNTTVLVPAFDPFGGTPAFTGGGFVSALDLDNDGKAEFVVSPDQGGGPRVTIYSFANPGQAATVRANFLGIDDAAFRGGVRTALGDVNNDGTADLVVAAGFQGGPRVALFNGTTLFATPTRLINDFFAFPGTDSVNLRNGVFVTTSDLNGDGFQDLVFGGGPGGAPRVFTLSGALISANNVTGAYNAPITNFFVNGSTTDRGGVRVAFADIDGDSRNDLVVASGEGNPAKVRGYLGKNITSSAEPTTFQDLDLFNKAVLANGVFVG